MFGWASRILNHFDQRKQRVETQINIGTAYGYSLPRKIDPRLALAPYLLDRSEQRTALMSYLAEKHWGGQTLSIVALGSEQHLPEALALTVFQLLSREFFPRAGLAALRPPTSPLCLEWPNNSKRGQLNWEAVAKYCLSAEPSGGMTRELLFANLKGSLIFGFHADFATWSSRSSDVWRLDPRDRSRALSCGFVDRFRHHLEQPDEIARKASGLVRGLERAFQGG